MQDYPSDRPSIAVLPLDPPVCKQVRVLSRETLTEVLERLIAHPTVANPYTNDVYREVKIRQQMWHAINSL